MNDSFPTLTFPALLKRSANRYSQRPAMAFVADTPITYHDFYERVLAVTAMLEKMGIKTNDKVAILSANMPNWGVAYFAITYMGAVVVPLLPDFSEQEIKNVLEHSEAKAMFVSRALITKVEKLKIGSLKTRIHIEDFSVCKGKELVFKLGAKPTNNYFVTEDMLAAIIYTSGTTGKSKGVMLTHRNICSNAVASRSIQDITPDDRFLSILPLSHTYENTIGFVLPFISGSSIYYLRKVPTPAVLLPALELVKPTLMLSVPLIIEKIYRGKILSAFNNKKITKSLYQKPFFRKMLNRMAGRKLKAMFGGHLKFFGIGGAKLDKEVEAFLLEAKFPYAIGYGLTETSPLLAGVNPKQTKLQSTGPALEGVTLKINDPNPETGEGEIWAKGPSVMKGYYKEPKLTKAILTKDGWFKTGDLGFIDEDGFLFIRGRIKNVIVGSGGENIFPEDIESVINNFPHVLDSLVVEMKGKLVALVHFDKEGVELKYREMKEKVADFSEFVEGKFVEMKNDLHTYVNSKVNRFSRIAEVKLQEEEFVKTATKKIKRFLYTDKNNKKTA
ncbi:MAG: long-chain fatty acid--CoA ligase [Bacteroidetes bacterium]|nr:MAG: long-chain fatty acid--CoA ligase [Bacteroidota bacterium]